jgi:hypothetical protein
MPARIHHHILYKNTRHFSSFPSISLLNQEKLLLMFRLARDSRWLLDESDEESALLKKQVDHIDSRSQLTQIEFDLDLNPISEPRAISINPEAADQDASLLRLADGRILLASFSWYPIHARLAEAFKKNGFISYGHPEITGCFYILWGGFTRYSDDMGKTWSQHQYLKKLPDAFDAFPEKCRHSRLSIRGQAIEIGEEILLPVYSRLQSNKKDTTHLFVSKDKGETWAYRSMIARDQDEKLDFTEPSLVQLNDGRIMAFMRNTTGNDHIVTAISADQGHSWKQWQETDITGHPAHPLKLSDGRIFLSYGYRHKPYGIRAQLLTSSGEQKTGKEIIIRDDGFCGDVGYPWSVELPDKRILIVYYFTGEDGIRHIAASLLSL